MVFIRHPLVQSEEDYLPRMESPPWPFPGLLAAHYSLILADPPWRFDTWSDKGRGKCADVHYSCMTLAQIQALPVHKIAAKDSVLFMWAIWPMLSEAIDTMSSWGFAYRTGGHWEKRKASGKLAFGTGYRVRSASEPWLLGIRGKPKNSRSHRNVIEGVVREHSRKPDHVYKWCSSYIEGPKAELFSRAAWPGFDVWGNESGKFSGEPL